MASSIINRQYSDLDLNFTIHPVRKDINRWTDEQAVIHSVRNLLVTNHYERPFQPDLGSNVRRMLFEPLDNITASNLTANQINTIITHVQTANTLISTRRYHDWNFYEKAYEILNDYYFVNQFTNIGNTSTYLVNNLIGTDLIKTNIANT